MTDARVLFEPRRPCGVAAVYRAALYSPSSMLTRPPEITGTPASLARYSLGFRIFTDEKTGLTWFGHGGAYSSGCYMCHEQKLLKLRAVQVLGYNGPAWGDSLEAASEAFFRSVGVDVRHKDEKPKPIPDKTSANAERGEVVL